MKWINKSNKPLRYEAVVDDQVVLIIQELDDRAYYILNCVINKADVLRKNKLGNIEDAKAYAVDRLISDLDNQDKFINKTINSINKNSKHWEDLEYIEFCMNRERNQHLKYKFGQKLWWITSKEGRFVVEAVRFIGIIKEEDEILYMYESLDNQGAMTCLPKTSSDIFETYNGVLNEIKRRINVNQ